MKKVGKVERLQRLELLQSLEKHKRLGKESGAEEPGWLERLEPLERLDRGRGLIESEIWEAYEA